MVTFVVQNRIEHTIVWVLTFLVSSQKLTNSTKLSFILSILNKSELAGRFSVTFACSFPLLMSLADFSTWANVTV